MDEFRLKIHSKLNTSADYYERISELNEFSTKILIENSHEMLLKGLNMINRCISKQYTGLNKAVSNLLTTEVNRC